MIVLDTNVISELFRPEPERKVMDWLADLPGEIIYTTAVTRGEILFGLYCLPDGRRKTDLLQQLTLLFDQKLAQHVLDYDGPAADAHARFAATRKARGRPVAMADAMIAGIAHSRGAALATRNVRDFEGCGVSLIDPWH
jgi:predicted nucleic acid-binding protein